MHTLTSQEQTAIDKVIANGSAYKALEENLKAYEKVDHFQAWPRMGFYSVFGKLNPQFRYQLSEALMENLEEKGIAIKFKRKEVGSLIRYTGGSFDGCILTDYLLSASSKMKLDNAQINELERLLNKVNRSLEVDLPVIPQPTEKEKQDAILELALEVIRSKPLHFHQKYLDQLASKGTPVNLSKTAFHDLAEKVLTP